MMIVSSFGSVLPFCLAGQALALGKTVLVGIMPVNIDYRLVRRMGVKPSMPAFTFFTKKTLIIFPIIYNEPNQPL